MNDRAFLRLGAGAAVAGGVLALVGNLLHPRYSTMENVDIYPKIAGSRLFIAADLVILAALVLTTVGFVGIAASLDDERAGGLSRFGRLAAIIGGTLALAQTGIETFAFVQAAKVFAGAAESDRVGSFWATNAIDHLNTGLFGTWTIVFLGLTPLLLGLAIFATRRYPGWLGALGATGGVLCLGVGVYGLMNEDQGPTQIPFLIGSLLVTVWTIAAGALLWRKTATEVPAPA